MKYLRLKLLNIIVFIGCDGSSQEADFAIQNMSNEAAVIPGKGSLIIIGFPRMGWCKISNIAPNSA